MNPIADEDENEDGADESNQSSPQSNVSHDETDETDTKAVKGEKVRDSIQRAIRQQQNEEGEEENEEEETKETAKETTPDKKDGDKSKEIKETKAETTLKKSGPPPGWTKAGKNHWAKLPPEVVESVSKREDEVSKGFKDFGEKVKDLEAKVSKNAELDTVFAPFDAELNKIGRTRAQFVQIISQWTSQLGNPDKNIARSALIQLGKNYGIEIEPKPVAQQQQTQNDPTKTAEQQSTTEIPAELKTFVDNVNSKLTSFEQKEEQRKSQEAQDFLNNWSKDKPHFPTVRQYMFSLLQSGVIPLKDGKLDLDSAYDQAVQANPATRELVRQEEQQKAEALAETKRKEKELKNLRKLNSAKTASSSISTRAPTGGTTTVAKGKDGKAPSVRDSLKQTIAELREAN